MGKRTKIRIVIASIILIILFIAQYYANSFAQKIIQNELNTLIEEQKDNYQIEVGKVKVQLLLMRFSINNIKVKTLDTIPIESDYSFDAEIDKIVVKIKSYNNVFNEGLLTLKSIELDHPKIKLINKLKTDSTLIVGADKFESESLQKIILGTLKVTNAELHYFESKEEDVRLVISTFDANLLLTNIEFSVDQQELKDKIIFDEFTLNSTKADYFDLKDHDFTLTEFHYSTKEKEIKIKGLSLKNKEDISLFNSNFVENKTWENIQAGDVHVNMDHERLKNKELFFQKIEIGNLDLIFSKNQGSKDSSSFNASELLSQIKVPFAIDTFKIKNGNVDLSFIEKGSQEIDDYSFKKLFIEFHFLSNDSNYIQNNPSILGKVNSTLWANGRLESHFTYHYKTLKNSAEIQLTNIPQRKLKKLFKDNDLAIYRSGIIDFFQMQYFADSTHFEGIVKANIKSLNLDYKRFPKSSSLEKISVDLDKIHLSSSFYKEKNKTMDLLIDTLIIESPKMNFLEAKKGLLTQIDQSVDKQNKNGPLLKVNLLIVKNASLSYTKEKDQTPFLSIEKASLTNKGLSFDFSNSDNNKMTSLGNYIIDLENLNVLQESSLYLTLNKTTIKSIDDKIKIIGLRYKNKSSKQHYHSSAKEGNIWNSAYIEEVSMTADLAMLLKNEFVCDNVKIVRPILTHIEAIDRKDDTPAKKVSEEFDFPIKIKNLSVIDADVDFRIKTKEVKEFEVFDLTNLNGSIKNIVLNAKIDEKSQMVGSFTSSFYEMARLNIEIQMEQGVKNPKIYLKGDASTISLLTLKNKLSLIKELNYSDGKIEKLNFDLINFKNKISGDFSFDKVNINDLLLSDDKNGDYLKLNLDELKLSFYKEKEGKLHITEAIVRKPEVDIHSIIKTKSKGSSTQVRKDLFADEKLFDPITHIDKIKIIDGKIEEFSGIGTDKHLFSIDNINLNGKNAIMYDSTNTTLPISINGLDFTMKDIKVHSFPLYDLTIESFEMNTSTQRAYLKNLDFKNKKTHQAFFNDLEYRKAWTQVIVPSMELDIGLNEFFAIHPKIKRIIIDKAYFKSLGDLALPVSNKEKPFPNRLLAMSSFPITVDSILIKNSQMDIEFIDEGNKYGLLQFNKVNASVSNLTTDKKAIEKNDEMKWVMDASLWESGNFHAEVTYKLGSKNDAFSMFGSMDNFDLIESEKLTKGLYAISVNSGYLYHSTFKIQGDNDQASGSVSFDYDELRVNLDKKKKNIKSPEELKRIKRKDKLNESFVKNVIVNGLLSKDNMPENRNYIPRAEASYDREKNKSIFHLMWYTISSGLIEIVEAGMVKDIKNLNEFFKKKKKEE